MTCKKSRLKSKNVPACAAATAAAAAAALDWELLPPLPLGTPPGEANLDRMERSDICRRWATGGMRANVAGNRLTSDFMSDSSSSSWFRTCDKDFKVESYGIWAKNIVWWCWERKLPCEGPHWLVCCQLATPWKDAGGIRPSTQPRQTWRSSSWPGGSGLGWGSGRLPASTAPQSPEPAQATEKWQCY